MGYLKKKTFRIRNIRLFHSRSGSAQRELSDLHIHAHEYIWEYVKCISDVNFFFVFLTRVSFCPSGFEVCILIEFMVVY